MEKRDKLINNNGEEIDCNIVGLLMGINNRKIVVYTTSSSELELLASYYEENNNIFKLSPIDDDREWEFLENKFKELTININNNDEER